MLIFLLRSLTVIEFTGTFNSYTWGIWFPVIAGLGVLVLLLVWKINGGGRYCGGM